MKINITSKTYQQFYINFKNSVIAYQGSGLASEVRNAGKFVGEINENRFWISKESLLPQRVPKVKFYGAISEENGITIKGHFRVDTLSTIVISTFSVFVFVVLLKTKTPPQTAFAAMAAVALLDLFFILMIYAFNVKKIHDIIKFLSSL